MNLAHLPETFPADGTGRKRSSGRQADKDVHVTPGRWATHAGWTAKAGPATEERRPLQTVQARAAHLAPLLNAGGKFPWAQDLLGVSLFACAGGRAALLVVPWLSGWFGLIGFFGPRWAAWLGVVRATPRLTAGLIFVLLRLSRNRLQVVFDVSGLVS